MTTSDAGSVQQRPQMGTDFKYGPGQIILPNGSKCAVGKQQGALLDANRENIAAILGRIKMPHTPHQHKMKIIFRPQGEVEAIFTTTQGKEFHRVKFYENEMNLYGRLKTSFARAQSHLEETFTPEIKRATAERQANASQPVDLKPTIPLVQSVFKKAQPEVPAKPSKTPTLPKMQKEISKALASKTSRKIRLGFALGRIFKRTKTRNTELNEIAEAFKQAADTANQLREKEIALEKAKTGLEGNLRNGLKDQPVAKKEAIDAYLKEKQEYEFAKIENETLMNYLNVRHATLLGSKIETVEIDTKEGILARLETERQSWYKAFGVVIPSVAPPQKRQMTLAQLLPQPLKKQPSLVENLLQRAGSAIGLVKTAPKNEALRQQMQWEAYQVARKHRKEFEDNSLFKELGPEIDRLMKAPYEEKEYDELNAFYGHLKRLSNFLSPAQDEEFEGMEIDSSGRLVLLEDYIKTLELCKQRLTKILGPNFKPFEETFDNALALISRELEAFVTPPRESQIIRRLSSMNVTKVEPKTEVSWVLYLRARDQRLASLKAIFPEIDKVTSMSRPSISEIDNKDMDEKLKVLQALDKELFRKANAERETQKDFKSFTSEENIQARLKELQEEHEFLDSQIKLLQEMIGSNVLYSSSNSLRQILSMLSGTQRLLAMEETAFKTFGGVK